VRRLRVAALAGACVLALLAGCSRAGRARSKDPSAVVLRVSGEEVTQGEIDTVVAYFQSYFPEGAREEELIRSALADDLIPNAAIRAGFRERLPGMLERAKALRERILAGEDFAEVAAAETEEAPYAPRGGDKGDFGRGDLIQPLARIVFSLEDGEVSEPIVTRYGVHLVKRAGSEAGAKPIDDTVRLSQILFFFEKGLAGRILTDSIIEEAKLEIVEPWVREFVPARFLPE
jgi:hypothetical protein